MSFWCQNIKYLRTQNGYTQDVLAKELSISRSSISALENGKFEPSIDLLIRICDLFSVEIDVFLKENLSQRPYITLNKESPKILVVSIDDSGSEIINFIPEKAKAGYLTGYADVEYISELPSFIFPRKVSGTLRAFEISGDSMNPLCSGFIVIGRYIECVKDIKNSNRYVIVTRTKGIIFKKIINDISITGSVLCSSDNPLYEPFILDADEILELWEFYSFIGFDSFYDHNPFNQIQRYLEKIENNLNKYNN